MHVEREAKPAELSPRLKKADYELSQWTIFLTVPGLSDLPCQPAEPSWAEAVPAPQSVEVRGTTQSKLLLQTPPQNYSILRKQCKLPGTRRVATYARNNAKCLLSLLLGYTTACRNPLFPAPVDGLRAPACFWQRWVKPTAQVNPRCNSLE